MYSANVLQVPCYSILKSVCLTYLTYYITHSRTSFHGYFTKTHPYMYIRSLSLCRQSALACSRGIFPAAQDLGLCLIMQCVLTVHPPVWLCPESIQLHIHRTREGACIYEGHYVTASLEHTRRKQTLRKKATRKIKENREGGREGEEKVWVEEEITSHWATDFLPECMRSRLKGTRVKNNWLPLRTFQLYWEKIGSFYPLSFIWLTLFYCHIALQVM